MTNKPSIEALQKKIQTLQHEIEIYRKREKRVDLIQDRFFQIVDSISIPTFVIDRNHTVTHYNRAMENLTGISANKIIGTQKQWKAFYSKKRPVLADFIVDQATEKTIDKYYKDSYQKSSVQEGAYEVERFFPAIGTQGKWLFFTAAPLKDANGNILGAVETLQDVSERKQAEKTLIKSEKRLRTLLGLAPYSIVVFDMDGCVTYLNTAFTEKFGWHLDELKGKRIPYVPPDLRGDVSKNLKRLAKEKVILRHETKRLTKQGQVLDVVLRASVILDSKGVPDGELVILRDVTQEKRIARNNEAMHRISMALPEYFELHDLFDYVSNVIKELVGTEGGVALLLDEQRQQFFFMGAAYDDTATEKRLKEVRLGIDELIAGQVIHSGKPMLINKISKDTEFNIKRDRRLGYETRNLLLTPLRSHDRVIGVLCAINKKGGDFDEADMDLLTMLAGTVVLSIENARFAEEVRKAYLEVSSLNRAKDRVINLLSHELRTPIAVLNSSLLTLEKRLTHLPEDNWKPTLARARRNLDRLLEMQYRVYDIMNEKTFKAYDILLRLVEQCSDELEALVAQECGEGAVIERIRKRIEEEFGSNEYVAERIQIADFIKRRLIALKSSFEHREIHIQTRFEPAPDIYIPPDALQKIIDGLLKNGIENTPDEGQIQIAAYQKGKGTEMVVADYGVGITKENQSRLFEGIYATQETLDYSTKQPFDFNAGGKGMDLLRMKIFSERYHFKIEMNSVRCPQIPKDSDICPGRLSRCAWCKQKKGCHQSPATTFTLYFPPPPMTDVGNPIASAVFHP